VRHVCWAIEVDQSVQQAPCNPIGLECSRGDGWSGGGDGAKGGGGRHKLVARKPEFSGASPSIHTGLPSSRIVPTWQSR
jgi:hypothetical protein